MVKLCHSIHACAFILPGSRKRTKTTLCAHSLYIHVSKYCTFKSKMSTTCIMWMHLYIICLLTWFIIKAVLQKILSIYSFHTGFSLCFGCCIWTLFWSVCTKSEFICSSTSKPTIIETPFSEEPQAVKEITRLCSKGHCREPCAENL